jgi:hypothetical protein
MLWSGRAAAQELEPRVYLASPVGTNVVVVAAARSTGDVVADPTAPIAGARARIGVLAGAYFRSINFFGRSASLGATVPLLRGRASAPINGEEVRVDRFGQGDAQVRLTVNLAGSPAMDLRTFAKRGRHVNLGTSIVTVVPMGQYDGTRIVNLGSNRWAFKPELGLSAPVGERWLVDGYFGTWFFGDNADYLGQRRAQAPLISTQVHLSYNLSLRSWAAFDATFYSGGRLTVGGVANIERQANTRLGGTLSLPIGRRQCLRVSFSRGARVRLGANFTTLGVSWNYAWGRGL